MKNIPERAVLVLISAVVVVGSLATVVWVLVAGEGLSLDTIFLALSALAVALVFALYAKSEIDRLRKQAQGGKPPAGKAPAASSEG